MQHKEDIEVKTPEADGEAAPVDWKLARSLVEPLYLDQKLYTGEPRLAHADGMAEILKGVRNDDELIVAAYLFSVTDCIHDADRWIEKTFGKNVLQLVRDLEQLMHVSQRARSDNRESSSLSWAISLADISFIVLTRAIVRSIKSNAESGSAFSVR